LSFDDSEAADDFHQHLLRLTSDPANIALSGPRSSSKKSTGTLTEADSKSRKKYRAPNKSEISQPCAFQHVVNISQEDQSKYFSLQAYVRAKVEIIERLNKISLSGNNNTSINNSSLSSHNTSINNSSMSSNNTSINNSSMSSNNGHNIAYKRATSIRNFPKQAPPPPPPPKRNTSLSCHDLTA
jgi:hypothetical protein